MTDFELEPPDHELLELYRDALREEPQVSGVVAERVRRNMGDALLDAPIPGAKDIARAAGGTSSLWRAKLATVFVLGLAGGAAGHAFLGRGDVSQPTIAPPSPVTNTLQTHEEVTPVPAPTLSTPAPAETSRDTLLRPTASAFPRPSGTGSFSDPAAVRTRDDVLDAERMLLEGARVALARGDAEGALGAVQRYASKYPQGQLREEAEVVGIQALVRSGRSSDARARAAMYRAKYPNGFFRQAVEDTLRSEPSARDH